MFVIGALIGGGVMLANPPQAGSALAQAMLSGIMTGLFAAIALGWLVGAILWIVFGTKENARRSVNVVAERYRQYWAERVRAQHALAQGADREQVRQELWSYRIATEPDEVLSEMDGLA